MSGELETARRLRLTLGSEIEQLASGLRKVTQMTAHGPIDVTSQVLAVEKRRVWQLEEMIAKFESTARDG